MARKQKRKVVSRPRPAVRPQGPAPATSTPSPTPPSQTRVGGDQALVRAIEMSLGPGAPGPRRGRVVLDAGGDASIPLDRVPYFLPDLQRVGIVGVAMLVLLIAGSYAVNAFIH